MNLTKRQFGITALGAMLAATGAASRAGNAATCATGNVPLGQAIDRLVRAYPEFLRGAEGNDLVWRDGTRMPIQIYPLSRPPAEQLEQPDLAAQLARSYPAGDCALSARPEDDPGRVRYTPFFSRMYGERQKDVEAQLVAVPWPGRRAGTTIKVTRVNGVADKLLAVSRELSSLPQALHHAFDNPAGGYYWRPIAGTNRLSAHSFGIAVDITEQRRAAVQVLQANRLATIGEMYARLAHEISLNEAEHELREAQKLRNEGDNSDATRQHHDRAVAQLAAAKKADSA